jgi:hypothetical protein
MRINAHATALANGGFSNGFLFAEADGNVGIRQVAGNLVITMVKSDNGDVSLDAAGGGIYDRFSTTPAQVLSDDDANALWSRLKLTHDLGVNDLTAQTISTFETQYDNTYRQYWDLRKNATDYLPNGTPTTTHYTLDTLTLTSAGIANMRHAVTAALGHVASDLEVQNYAQALYTADVTFFDGQSCDSNGLHCHANDNDSAWRSNVDFGLTPASYNSSFAYHVANPSTQYTDLTKNAEWQPDELKYFVNKAALEPAPV